ncbi:MAG: TlpA disulfide reductase family protein [Bdellovibrionota bacterium]
MRQSKRGELAVLTQGPQRSLVLGIVAVFTARRFRWRRDFSNKRILRQPYRVRSWAIPSIEHHTARLRPAGVSFAANDKSFKANKRLPLAALFGDKDTLIINFWATWCAPCLDELPSLEQLNRRLGTSAKTPRLITISVDEKTAPIRSALQNDRISGRAFLVLHDPDGGFARELGTTRFS